MKETVDSFRCFVREVLIEDARNSETAPSGRYEPVKKYDVNVRNPTPIRVKHDLVMNKLHDMGALGSKRNMQTAVKNLMPWLKDYDPVELFVSSPDELAKQFNDQFLVTS